MALVVLEGVHVDFPIYGAQRSLRHAMFQRATGGVIQREGKHKERVVVRALSDISMRLEDGDRLGLMGHNGSGKSTLLKVIAGIYQPVSGRLTVQGLVTPLLDMMPGLDPDDTGYENLLTAGMLLGLSREQVEQKIPEIEEFSELGEYLALPVRTYSAGMTLRLGFSLVTALEPGILLMDEGFSTGDLRFAERAADRMDDFLGRSRIIVLASHSDETIKSMCNKGALMQEGQILAFGPVNDVIEQYREMVRANDRATEVQSAFLATDPLPELPVYNEETIRDVGLTDRLARTSGAVRFTKAVALDQNGLTRWVYAPGDTVTFRFDYEVHRPIPDLAFYFQLYIPADNSAGRQIVTDMREVLSANPIEAGKIGRVELTLPDLILMPNELFLYVYCGSVDNSAAYDVIDSNVDLPAFVVHLANKRKFIHGVISLKYELRNFGIETVLEHQ